MIIVFFSIFTTLCIFSELQKIHLFNQHYYLEFLLKSWQYVYSQAQYFSFRLSAWFTWAYTMWLVCSPRSNMHYNEQDLSPLNICQDNLYVSGRNSQARIPCQRWKSPCDCFLRKPFLMVVETLRKYNFHKNHCTTIRKM